MFNSSINVYKTEWLDLVFADRNKNYGAYDLRAKSSSIMTRALFVAGGLFLLLCFSPLIYAKFFPKDVIADGVGKVIEITPPDLIRQMKKDEPKPEKKPEPAKADPVKVKTIALPSQVVVVNKTELPPPPTVDDIKLAVISDKTQDGIVAPAAVLNTTKGDGEGSGVAKDGTGTAEDTNIYSNMGVDEYPEFTGGAKAWSKYMERNLRYPYQAQDANIQGKVFVSFVVERDGSVSDVKVLRGLGFGCDEEAMKVIKKSPLWKPGRNKGVPVRVRYNMAINFQIS